MSTINFTYHSDVVLGFKEIPESAYSRQVYFIEQNETIIQEMDDVLRIDLFDKYSKALMELGQFKKCLNNLDALIFDVVDTNHRRQEEDLFYNLLIRKAKALFSVGEFENAEHVAKELVKIDPNSSDALKILRESKCIILKNKTAGLRALIVMLLLFGLGITCFDLLVIQNFFPEHTSPILLVRNGLIGGALLCLLGIEVAARMWSKYDSSVFQNACLDKKS